VGRCGRPGAPIEETIMLSDSRVHANIPAADIERARRFYTESLGLSVTDERDGLLMFTTDGGTTFMVYQTEFAGQAGHTIAQWHVDDIDGEVKDLKGKGVMFEEYDMPGVSWSDSVASIPTMGRAAWFKDSEGNIMCLDDADM
jgi:predicted enzyme related to lactoylglutathione lyase